MLAEEAEEAEYGTWISATDLLSIQIVCPICSTPGNFDPNFEREGE
jgi:hypothetical protein